VFNPEKLEWLNAHYIKATPIPQLATLVVPFLEARGIPVPSDRARLEAAMATLRDRARTLVELADLARFYFVDAVALDPGAAASHLTPASAPLLDALAARLGALPAWTHEGIEAAVRETAAQHGVKLGALAQPVRVAVTGTAASPGIFEVLLVLGRDTSLRRLADARAQIVAS